MTSTPPPHLPAEPEPPGDGAHTLAQLVAENAMLRTALEHMPLGLCMFDGGDRLLLANARYGQLWDIPPAQTRRGTTFADIMAVTRGTETDESRQQPVPRPGTTGMRRREWAMDDGRTIEVVVTRLADGSSIAVHENITEQRRAEAQIAYLARHDPLTGLPNRRAMREELERLIHRNARGEPLAVLCLDLDRFKAVNDNLGHAAGDVLLTQVAERLRACARGTDLCVRIGGDEFAVLQCGSPQPASSTALARRLIDALGEPFDLGGEYAQIGTSIGIALAPHDGANPDALLKSGDLALYRAKAEGRGTLRYFEPEMDARTRARRALEADLRLAVAKGEFHLVYQPQVDIRTGAVTGVEALLRWDSASRGAVLPVEFIGVAEETGLIVPIGRWVLQQACRDAAAWRADVRLAVNVSAVQFALGDLQQDVEAALAHAQLPGHRLELEITESVLVHDEQHALATLRALRARGVHVAMDDFGTGYSSLSYLRSFPFDRIKIDRSFVHDLESDPHACSIVRAVASLGRSLGMATTVEGVETHAQLAIVRREGCTEVQGDLYSPPRPAAEVPALIQQLEQAGHTAWDIGL